MNNYILPFLKAVWGIIGQLVVLTIALFIYLVIALLFVIILPDR